MEEVLFADTYKYEIRGDNVGTDSVNGMDGENSVEGYSKRCYNIIGETVLGCGKYNNNHSRYCRFCGNSLLTLPELSELLTTSCIKLKEKEKRKLKLTSTVCSSVSNQPTTNCNTVALNRTNGRLPEVDRLLEITLPVQHINPGSKR